MHDIGGYISRTDAAGFADAVLAAVPAGESSTGAATRCAHPVRPLGAATVADRSWSSV